MHFINGLERSKTFFLITGLTLTGQQGGLVNLRLRLITYLRASDLKPASSAHPGRGGPTGRRGGSPLMAIKVGTEDKKKVYLAGGLGLVMLILLVRFLWQTFGPSPSPRAGTSAAPGGHSTPSGNHTFGGETAQENTTAAAYAHPAAKIGGLASLDPTLHPEIMRQAESLEYTGSGRNIFSQFSAPPAIPKPIAPIRQAHVDTGPPPPPPPPPINLGFYGYAAEKTGQKQVFLLHGDDIFIASEGDVVDRRYRVVKIGPPRSRSRTFLTTTRKLYRYVNERCMS